MQKIALYIQQIKNNCLQNNLLLRDISFNFLNIIIESFKFAQNHQNFKVILNNLLIQLKTLTKKPLPKIFAAFFFAHYLENRIFVSGLSLDFGSLAIL